MTQEEKKIDEIRACLDNGRKIEAIKMIRHATGLGLKEAKDLADDGLVDLKPEMIAKLGDAPEAKGCGSAAMLFLAGGILYSLTQII